MNGRTTIADVAKKAGVSKTTVSHALSGKRPISSEVKEQIFMAAKELGYNPSFAAKAINGQRMMIVAALIDGVKKPSSGVLMEAFQRVFAKHGYDMAVYICGTEVDKTLRLMRRLSGGLVDGILNLIPEITVNQAICASSPIPSLTYLRPHIDSPVYLDISGGVKEALDYLWGLGHRKIGFIGGERIKAADTLVDPQLEGYRVFFESRGAWNPELVRMSPGEFEDGIVYADELWKRGITAIIAANDQVACGVLSWASREGVRIPDDLSVVGYNDSPLAVMVVPALTTIQFPVNETAEITASALVAKIEGQRFFQHKIVTPRLIVRNSTARATQRKG